MKPVSRKPVETAPARMAPLDRLPVFLDLKGKRAVVIGGTPAATWKAELLASAGAEVGVLTATPCTEMRALVGQELAGRISLLERQWTPADFDGAAVAVADAASDEDAARIADAAAHAGVPLNVIDRPAICRFQFGTIVNRSPVVIGISTAGTAPILGQRIRQRIETMLPQSLAAWAALAGALRPRVSRRLAPGAQRRTFWERLADKAFGPHPDAGDSRALEALIDRVGGEVARENGRVTMVGAGPGDAELLTLKAVRALQAADVILYDDLVSDDVLELARREARRMLVGKRGQRESCNQDDINALMLKLARQGRHVVRLKSGDPMIFGRAGEEIAMLEQHGIRVDVVPGITSALALASALGVSLTHRNWAHSVRFVTGHSRHGELPSTLDWRGLADPETSLVVYMGGRTASRLAERLIAEGLAPDTPVVVASCVGRPEAHALRATLQTLGQAAGYQQQSGPVLIGIGKVFEHARAAHFADHVPAPLAAVG